MSDINDLNRKLVHLLDDADNLLKVHNASIEPRLLTAYRNSLRRIKESASRLFERTNNPTINDANKFNRLSNLYKQLASEIKGLNTDVGSIIESDIKNEFASSYTDTTKAFNSVLDLGLDFNSIPKKSSMFEIYDNMWLNLLKKHNANLLVDVKMVIESALRTNARSAVVEGLTMGDSYSTITRLITDRFNVAATRAKMISFTETHKAHSKGRVLGIQDAIESAGRLGIVIQKIWKHNHIGKPRPSHLAHDGKPADLNGMFHVGGETIEGPGLGSLPENNIYCHCSAQTKIISV
jgi:hypothetical protein